jgi:hypothetical protein
MALCRSGQQGLGLMGGSGGRTECGAPAPHPRFRNCGPGRQAGPAAPGVGCPTRSGGRFRVERGGARPPATPLCIKLRIRLRAPASVDSMISEGPDLSHGDSLVDRLRQ